MEQNSKIYMKKSTRVAKNKRILIICVCIMLALVVALTVTVSTVAIVRDSRAVIKYGGTMVDKGVASYLAATYKSLFMSGLEGAYDTPLFWESQVESASTPITYGQLLKQQTDKYIKQVVIGAYLFDRYTSLTKTEKEAISRACEDVLSDRVGGSEEKFNENCRAMGFTYSDFKLATELIYKSEQAQDIIYGPEGTALNNPDRYSECDTYYYNEFSHVEILFIPTKIELIKDEDGNLEKDSDGLYKYQYFTQLEIIERRADIEEIRTLIEGYRNGSGEQISEYYFDSMQEKYSISNDFLDTGYYFSPYSTFSLRFAEESSRLLPSGYKEAFFKCLEAIRDTSYGMSSGQYYEIEGDYGTAFIHTLDKTEHGYLSSEHTEQFHDFFSDAADYLYGKAVEKITPDVEVREEYADIVVTEIPYNYYYVAKVGVTE